MDVQLLEVVVQLTSEQAQNRRDDRVALEVVLLVRVADLGREHDLLRLQRDLGVRDATADAGVHTFGRRNSNALTNTDLVDVELLVTEPLDASEARKDGFVEDEVDESISLLRAELPRSSQIGSDNCRLLDQCFVALCHFVLQWGAGLPGVI